MINCFFFTPHALLLLLLLALPPPPSQTTITYINIIPFYALINLLHLLLALKLLGPNPIQTTITTANTFLYNHIPTSHSIHSYKYCLVPLFNQCGISQSTSSRKYHLMTGSYIIYNSPNSLLIYIVLFTLLLKKDFSSCYYWCEILCTHFFNSLFFFFFTYNLIIKINIRYICMLFNI